MAGRNRRGGIRSPEVPYGSGGVDPVPDDCCCSWLKPKSKNSNKNDSSSPGVSRVQQGTPKPIDTAKNGAFKEKQVLTQDQENSHGISGNMKSSSQLEDYRPQEIKKNGKYTAPNATNVTKNKDQGNSEEENNASHGDTRPEKTISSSVEQASTLKVIKNRQEDILEDQHKGVHKPEYNHGIHRDTGPDLTKKESSSPEQAAGVQKREGKQKETKGINNNDEQFKDC